VTASADPEYFDISYSKDPEYPRDILFRINETQTIPFGGFDKLLQLEFEDRTPRRLVIKLHGRVTPPIVAKPPRINFGALRRGDSTSKAVRLHSTYGGTIRLGTATSNHPAEVIADLSAATRDQGDIVLPVIFKAIDKGEVVAGVLRLTATADGHDVLVDIGYDALVNTN
jgi:hypothetical protein